MYIHVYMYSVQYMDWERVCVGGGGRVKGGCKLHAYTASACKCTSTIFIEELSPADLPRH